VDALTFPHVHGDHTLDQALERMGAARLDVLPVVSRADIHKLEGIITLGDVLVAYGVGPQDPGLTGGSPHNGEELTRAPHKVRP
jgi:CBS domain-containing protein